MMYTWNLQCIKLYFMRSTFIKYEVNLKGPMNVMSIDYRNDPEFISSSYKRSPLMNYSKTK